MRVAVGALVFLAVSAAWAGPKIEPLDLQKVFDIEIIGHPHGTNDLKVLATGAEVTDRR